MPIIDNPSTIPNDLLLVLSAKNAPFGKIISNFKLKPSGIISNKFSYKTSLAKSEMHISDVFSFTPTPDPAIIFIGIVLTELLKEIFSKETIVHISKFWVMSRSKPDFAKEIPNAWESSLSKPTEWISIFISFFSLGIFISS